MEFALTRKQLNKKRAEAAASAPGVHGAPVPGAEAGPSWSPLFPGTPQGGGPALAGDGVPPLLPEGFGRPAVIAPPDPIGRAAPPSPPGFVGLDAPPSPPGFVGLDAPPSLPGVAGLDAPPGAFVPEQPSATRLRLRHRVSAGERVVQGVHRYVGVAVVVAAIVAAALLVPAAHHSGSPSGAPAASRPAVTTAVR